MMRWILLAVLVIALTTAATIVSQFLPSGTSTEGGVAFPHDASDQAGPPAKAVLVKGGDTTYNFGTAAQFTKGEYTWVIKNEGPGILELSQGYASCSCTIANLVNLKEGERAVVKPGEETTVRLTWNTKEAKGRFNQHAEVLTHNDPNRQKFDFAVSGMVSPALVTVPAGTTISFMGVSNSEVNRAKIALFSPDKDDLEITSLTTSKPEWINVKFQPLDENERQQLEAKAGYRIDLELKAGYPLGPIHEELVVKTNHPKQPELKMHIEGKAVGPISVMPEHVRMSLVSGSREAKESLTIWVRGGDTTHFEVVGAPSYVKADVAEVDDSSGASHKDAKSRRYRLNVTVPSDTPPGLISGPILLKTDHPQAAEIKVPVNVVVEAAGS